MSVLSDIIAGTVAYKCIWQEAGPAESGLYSCGFGNFFANLSPTGVKVTMGNKTIADITTGFSDLTTAVEGQLKDRADAAEGELAEYIAAEQTDAELAMSTKIAAFKVVKL